MELNVAIIGIGNMGGAHARTIASGRVNGLRLKALCDTDSGKTAALKDEFGVPVYTDYTEMLSRERPDAVIVATPHYSHCEIAEYALKAGLHTLVEKPVGVRLSEVKSLVEAAEGSGRVFAAMYNQRTNQLFSRAKRMLDEGRLGKLKRACWIITNWYRTQAYYDSGTWRATWGGEGGGVLMNQAPHQLDLWQWLLGMPKRVTATGAVGKYHNIEVEDEVTLLMEYDDATGIFTTSTGEYPGTNRLEVSGTKGKLVLEEGKLKFWQLEQDEEIFRFESKESFAHIPLSYSEYEESESIDGHLSVLQNFTNAILHGEPLLSPGRDGPREVELSNAAYLSMWTGRTVSLPIDSGEYNRELDKLIKSSGYKPDGTQSKGGAESASRSGYSERWKVQW